LERHLLQILQGARLNLDGKYNWVWEVGELQTYSVNSAYVLLRQDREEELSFVYSKLWISKALPFALFTAWRVLENKIATTVNLERRGIVIDNLLCCLCGKEEESHRHLFFDCIFVWLVCCLCFEWLGVMSVIHCNALGLVSDFWGAIWVGVVSEI